MKHYILTRFNLALWAKDKMGIATASKEWLDDRVRLFENYCLPSINGQNCKDFKWIILFDADSDEHLGSKIDGWRSQCPNMTVKFVSRQHAWKWVQIFRKMIIADVEGKQTKVVTTYLDNDDALEKDYVARAQEAARKLTPNNFISFCCGIQYFERNGYALKLDYTNNHFISLVEDYDPIQEANGIVTLKTVMGYGSHVNVAKHGDANVLYVDNDTPRWLEVVHSRNVINDVRMSSKFTFVHDSNALQDYFGMDVKLNTNFLRYAALHYPRIVGQIAKHIKWHLFGSPNGKWG
ncbi:MAG: hypothetical protein HUJ98_12600 [Bacteroidaceae bacterium]|nr:hypothetical protein [Bacteroidaceae bacterium]